MRAERRLVIGAASIDIRRRVGPTAWAVFEELAVSSTGADAACRASVSVRSLASQLGMSKDTVARALTRLRAAGLVSANQTRQATGAFAAGNYHLFLPASVALDDSLDTTAHSQRPASQARPPAHPPRSPRSRSSPYRRRHP